jgi:hypothetical protein
MKLNRSLAISSKIQECKAGDILGMLSQEFPAKVLEDQFGSINKRNRVFTANNTLLTMVLTAIQQDKTLKNSVDLYYIIHQQRQQAARQELGQAVEEEKAMDTQKQKKAGRPKHYAMKLPGSLEKDISLNTAAYSKARERVPLEMAQALFDASRIGSAQNAYTHWHGYRVLIGDGTYVQMQDTPLIRKDYEVKHKGKGSEGYPQGLLEAIIERGSGQIFGFKLANRHVSELALFYEMMDGLPAQSLLLLDDLYNCYEILAKSIRKGIALVVAAKRERNYQVVEVLGEGDEVIQIKTPKNRSKWLGKNEPPGDLLLRRIQCNSPEGSDYVLYTTLLDKTINKHEIQGLYLSRWDIEVSIRELKTIMDVNILRSKTPEMALKELTVSLATYNLIRKMIYTSIKDMPFSPKEDFIYQFYTLNKGILIDKKGRVYNRWSSGRRRTDGIDSGTSTTKTKTKQKI